MTATTPTTNDSILRIEQVSRRFGTLQALDELSLSVAAGERVALLGHNGAGKTTLFRLILGFITPDAGQLSIDGCAPGSDVVRRQVAYLPESAAFPGNLTARELLHLYARLKNVSVIDADNGLDQVGLSHAADRRVGGYSKGMRQRLALAQALLGKPKILLLDEPTSGLDPLSRQAFYTLVDAEAARGAAVLQASHSLNELAHRTDRIAIMKSGRLIADAPFAALQNDASMPIRLRVRARTACAPSVAQHLGGQRCNGHSVEVIFPPSEKVARLQAVGQLGDLVEDVHLELPSLDDLYRHYCAHDDLHSEEDAP